MISWYSQRCAIHTFLIGLLSKNNYGVKMQLTICWSGSSYLHHMEAKIQLSKSYCYPIYGCALWRHSYQNSIRKLTVSYSDTFKRLIDVPWYTSSSLAFAMSATDHINVVLFRKFAYDLMSRVTTSSNSIVTAIVNSDAYLAALSNDGCVWKYITCTGIIIGWIIF